jgi:Domain of unknown function (DUF6916)
MTMHMHLGELTFETARPLIGTTFEVTCADGRTTALTLDEALPYDLPARQQRGAPKRRPFSLYLVGDPAIVLPQGTYTLRAPAATFENLFIVPIGRDGSATEYEAVFT